MTLPKQIPLAARVIASVTLTLMLAVALVAKPLIGH